MYQNGLSLSIRQIINMRIWASFSFHKFLHGVVTLTVFFVAADERLKLLAHTHTHLHDVNTICHLKGKHRMFKSFTSEKMAVCV